MRWIQALLASARDYDSVRPGALISTTSSSTMYAVLGCVPQGMIDEAAVYVMLDCWRRDIVRAYVYRQHHINVNDAGVLIVIRR